MRKYWIVMSLALAGCSAEQVASQLTREGWTQHQFAGSERDWMRYLCDPRDTNPDPRAASAHARLDAGIGQIAERAADDVVAGRITALQFSLQIQRQTEALAAAVEADTGCVLLDSSEN